MRDETHAKGRRESLKTLTWGLVWIVGAAWFVFDGLVDPISDLRLMLDGRTAADEIIGTFEDVDGRVVEGVSKGSGRLPADLVDLKASVPVEVEYHPDTPSLNRLKGDGSHTLGGWLLRTAGLT